MTNDQMFQMVGVGSDQDPAQLSSSLVLAGLVARGSPTLLDTHPQVYHQWLYGHNLSVR